VDTLDPQTRPFAALALGLSGNRNAGQRALQLLGEDLSAGTPDLVRDALYFLGEVACRTTAHELTESVAGLLRSDDDVVLRAASWCFGALAKSGADCLAGIRELVDLALRHPLETVRFEAVTALAKTATARRASPLVSEILRALREDGAGRVRYGAMQNLRLMSAQGLDASPEALAHDSDPDFGVLFERELLQEATG
jgi:HEAT repeat protein